MQIVHEDVDLSGLTAGGNGKKLALAGRYVGLHPASHPSAIVEVALGHDPPRTDVGWHRLSPGVVLPVGAFSALLVRLASGTPATAGRVASVYACEEPFGFAPRAQQLDADGLPVGQAQPSTLTCAQVAVSDTATQVAGSSSERRSLLVRNAPDSASSVFVGGANTVTDATGFELAPGEAIELAATGTVYAICSAGENATVHVAEEAL